MSDLDNSTDQDIFRNKNAKAAKFPQLLATAISCVGAIAFGFTLGYSSPAIPELADHGILDSDAKMTWFGSIVTIGAVIGGPIGGYLIEYIGRKITIMSCCIPYAMGWLCIIIGKNYIAMYIGRMACGIGVGMTSTSVPLYIGEIASKEFRGALGTGYQLSVGVGVLLAYVLGLWLHWNWLAVVGAITALCLALLMLIVPETPRYLMSKGDEHDAMDSLRWLRGPHYNIEKEFAEIKHRINIASAKMNIRELKNPAIYKPFLLILGLMFFQQMSPVTSIVFYAQGIFQEAGYKGDPRLAAVIVVIVQIGATLLSSFLIDKLGRKILLVIGGFMMGISCIAFGVYYYLHEHHPENADLNWLPLASTVVFIAMYSLGWGPVPWLCLGEILPIKAKGLASSLSVSFYWIVAFTVTKEYIAMENALTEYGTYWLFASICFLGVLFVTFFMLETKGKSLEEIQAYFEGRLDRADEDMERHIQYDEPLLEPLLE